MKKLHIATSPLTNTIFAGTLLKKGNAWANDKQDLTIEALVAVAEHVERFGEPVEIQNAKSGEIEYRITVESLKKGS